MIIIYVDDVLLAATDNAILVQNVRQIVTKFTISSEGPVDTFLNITIGRPSNQPLMEQRFTRFNLTLNPSRHFIRCGGDGWIFDPHSYSEFPL